MKLEWTDKSDVAIGPFTVSDLQFVVASALEFSDVRSGIARYHHTDKWHDYDGFPFQQFHKLEDACNADSPTWGILLTYCDTTEHDFDFEELARRGQTTAYRFGSAGFAALTRFKLQTINLYPERKGFLENSTEARLMEHIPVMTDYYKLLKEKISSLAGWFEAGYDAVVMCSNRNCASWPHRVTIANSRIGAFASTGYTLDRLREKLVCKHCGNYKPRVWPRHISTLS